MQRGAEKGVSYSHENLARQSFTHFGRRIFESMFKSLFLILTIFFLSKNERKDLDPKYINLVKMADEMKANNVEKYWTCGVAFEFCQLDKSKDQ